MANTTFGELKRLVLQRLAPRSDGQTLLAVEQAINEAQKNIARVKDFDELIVLDVTHAFTVASQKLYHITTDLALVRPKDIYTIRYMDEVNSRKLEYVSPRKIDERIPYTETFTTGRPKWYTRRGMYLELFRIPDAAKPLYILHSQWPAVLSSDTSETPYLYLDDVIVTLAADIALSIIEEGVVGSWFERAKQLLGIVLKEDETRPDIFYVAQPFSARERRVLGSYWLNPFIKCQPE